MRSSISWTFIFASCVSYLDRACYGVYVPMKVLRAEMMAGVRPPLILECGKRKRKKTGKLKKKKLRKKL